MATIRNLHPLVGKYVRRHRHVSIPKQFRDKTRRISGTQPSQTTRFRVGVTRDTHPVDVYFHVIKGAETGFSYCFSTFPEGQPEIIVRKDDVQLEYEVSEELWQDGEYKGPFDSQHMNEKVWAQHLIWAALKKVPLDKDKVLDDWKVEEDGSLPEEEDIDVLDILFRERYPNLLTPRAIFHAYDTKVMDPEPDENWVFDRISRAFVESERGEFFAPPSYVLKDALVEAVLCDTTCTHTATWTHCGLPQL